MRGAWRCSAARDLAGLAATIGHFFSYAVLAKAAREIGEGMLVDALDELWQRRIIRETVAGGYDFSDDKIRAAAYQGQQCAPALSAPLCR